MSREKKVTVRFTCDSRDCHNTVEVEAWVDVPCNHGPCGEYEYPENDISLPDDWGYRWGEPLCPEHSERWRYEQHKLFLY